MGKLFQYLALLTVLTGVVAALQYRDAECHQFVISPPEAYQNLVASGWEISSQPVWSPDSSLVLFDKQGNVPFTRAELDSLEADSTLTIIADVNIQIWLEEHGWNGERP
jgi:hypothetical protein